jgi:hypothetical protein
LPDVAFERRLGVDLELVNIDAFAEQLLQWLHEPRVMGHQPEGFVIGMRGECGARRAGLLAPDLPAVGPENAVGFAAQDRDFVFGETVRKEYVALLVEGLSCSEVSFMVSSRMRRRGGAPTTCSRRILRPLSSKIIPRGRCWPLRRTPIAFSPQRRTMPATAIDRRFRRPGGKNMRSRTRFALVLALGLCAALPVSAQTFTPDRRRRSRAPGREPELVHVDPFPLVQHLVDKFQQDSGIKIQLCAPAVRPCCGAFSRRRRPAGRAPT